jgi:hypothetical protein
MECLSWLTLWLSESNVVVIQWTGPVSHQFSPLECDTWPEISGDVRRDVGAFVVVLVKEGKER